MIDNPNDETNFPQKLLLADTRIANLRKTFANKSYQLISCYQKLNNLR